MQKGSGVYVNPNYTYASAFNYFISNSKCYILSSESKGGLIFRLLLNDDARNDRAPYITSSSNSINKIVEEIILKVIYISDDGVGLVITSRSDPSVNHCDFNNTTLNDFKTEINNQINIYTNSLDQYLEPICPAILCADILYSDMQNMQAVLNKLIENSLDDDCKFFLFSLQQLKCDTKGNPFALGIVAMECMSSYITLNQYITDNGGEDSELSQNAKIMALYEICRLYSKKFIHGDLTQKNILIDPNYNYFNGSILADSSTGKNGRAILIDFGSSFKVGGDDEEVGYEEVGNDNQFDNPANNQQQSLYDYVIPSIETDYKYELGTAHTHPPYQWLKASDYDPLGYYEAAALTTQQISAKLFYLNMYRMITKIAFINHVGEHFLHREPAHPLFVGGAIDVINKTSLPFVKPLNDKQNLRTSETFVKPLNNKQNLKTSETFVETPVILNIFDKLDPEHKLTLNFIKDYIKKEKEYSNYILEKVKEFKDIKDIKYNKDVKGGYKKSRRIKSRRIKSRRIDKNKLHIK